jgi:glycosyltransferase involved in cell wall biosynthesis
MPEFSIVMACYNATETLAETLASLQAQTVQDWEAVCVDDGSDDETFFVLRAAARLDPRIKVIWQKNAGPSIARNTGVTAAQGGWIAFLDADDLWVPEKLAIVTDVIERTPDAAAVFGKVAFFETVSGDDTAMSSVKAGKASLVDLLGENPVCTLSNLCVRRDAFQTLGGFDTSMRYSEDLEFIIRLVAAGFPLIGTTSLLIRYRASNHGLSSDLMRMHDGWRQAIDSAGALVSSQQRARAEAIHLRYLARRALRLGQAGPIAATIAIKGLLKAPLTFLGDRHRGVATLLGSLASPFLPRALRRKLFA